MNDTFELLRDYFATVRDENEFKWRYEWHPARKKVDVETKRDYFRKWQDAVERRHDLEETIESYLMTRSPRTGA